MSAGVDTGRAEPEDERRRDAPRPLPEHRLDRAVRKAVRQRKARDAAAVLPLAGALLLTPPVATLAASETRVLGVPLVVAYVFGVWAALILAAFLLGRRLDPAATGERGDADGRDG